MPRRKVVMEERINDHMENLMNDINNTEEEVKSVAWQATSAQEERVKATKQELVRKMTEIVRLTEDGKIDQSVKYLEKASSNVINKIQYEAKKLEKPNPFLTDLTISKFAYLLGGLDAIDSSNKLDKELQNRFLK